LSALLSAETHPYRRHSRLRAMLSGENVSDFLFDPEIEA
jgi:hypothetical protein